MTIPIAEKTYSFEEYLELEKRSTEKLEFRNGKIVPMSGGTTDHNEIAANIIAAIKFQIKKLEKRYHLYTSDMKIQIKDLDFFVYPDTVVVAEKPLFYKDRKDIITNPLLIVEVLSPSTATYDRGVKFDFYRHIPSFREYMLVQQDRPYVSVFYREEENLWRTTDVGGKGKEVELQSIGCALSLDDIYDNIDFS
jgi:Uma2 family endonuclease